MGGQYPSEREAEAAHGAVQVSFLEGTGPTQIDGTLGQAEPTSYLESIEVGLVGIYPGEEEGIPGR